MAPARPGYWLTRRVRRAGRQDARKYQSVQDFTRTHAIISAQSRARGGQQRVNQWVIHEIEPIRTGTLALDAKAADLRERRAALSAALTPNGSVNRAIRRNQQQLDAIDNELVDIAKQRESNLGQAERILRAGRQALNSWVSFYAQVAAEYERFRVGRRRALAASNQAEIPRFESEPLEYYDDFAAVYDQLS